MFLASECIRFGLFLRWGSRDRERINIVQSVGSISWFGRIQRLLAGALKTGRWRYAVQLVVAGVVMGILAARGQAVESAEATAQDFEQASRRHRRSDILATASPCADRH